MSNGAAQTKRIVENARRIANLLYEEEQGVQPTSMCTDCAKEHGVRDRNISHGVCKRHFLEWAKANYMDQRETDQMVANTEEAGGFAPDLGPVTKSATTPAQTKSYLQSRYPTLFRYLQQGTDPPPIVTPGEPLK